MTKSEKYQYYKDVVLKSKPLIITKLLRNWWMYVFYIVLLCVYGYTMREVKMHSLADIDKQKSVDYFDNNDHRTQKMFVLMQLGDSINPYKEYL